MIAGILYLRIIYFIFKHQIPRQWFMQASSSPDVSIAHLLLNSWEAANKRVKRREGEVGRNSNEQEFKEVGSPTANAEEKGEAQNPVRANLRTFQRVWEHSRWKAWLAGSGADINHLEVCLSIKEGGGGIKSWSEERQEVINLRSR